MFVVKNDPAVLKDYLEFLASLPLDKGLAKTKTLEADLKGSLNPSRLLDRLFFQQNQWVDFEKFYQLYLQENEALLKRTFPQLPAPDLYTGLRARLYRTQCGILTEYQAYLGAQVIFGEENVMRYIEMDRQGVDFSIKVDEQLYHIHIFVDSPRAWQFRRYKTAHKQVERMEGIHVNLPYALSSGKIHSLYYLPNGFGVYTPAYLRYLQAEIASGKLLHYKVTGIHKDGFIYDSIS